MFSGASTTPSGIPVVDCETCGKRHPITRKHCRTCGNAHFFGCALNNRY